MDITVTETTTTDTMAMVTITTDTIIIRLLRPRITTTATTITACRRRTITATQGITSRRPLSSSSRLRRRPAITATDAVSLGCCGATTATTIIERFDRIRMQVLNVL
eukprot:TRINITY_DN5659_c0_g1_i2.p2 TRINITY_DN5659_c0_g1~~TRINITY_DN5659_c0_g1_i2.p2  ORF type:complete len:107 (-),score=23.54 TRINITY_DN5659_c0_g1_i2:307-627(-)